jgi:hypothetical protein
MATQQPDPLRIELEEEYVVWATICMDKHGLPWPIKQESVSTVPVSDLLREIKKLKILGRTPHEG